MVNVAYPSHGLWACDFCVHRRAAGAPRGSERAVDIGADSVKERDRKYGGDRV